MDWLTPETVYASCFTIFVVGAFRFVRKPVLDALDGEIKKIRGELDHAKLLRAEAEQALVDCKTRQAAAEAEARQIVSDARRRVETMRQQAEADLAAMMERHEKLAAEHILLAEAEALRQVRAAAIDMAMKIARQSLLTRLADADASRLVDRAIQDIPALCAVKAA